MTNHFLKIPDEIILHISNYLNENSLNNWQIINKDFNRFTKIFNKSICISMLYNKYQLNLYHIPNKYISVWKNGIVGDKLTTIQYRNSNRTKTIYNTIEQGFNLSFLTNLEKTNDWAKIIRHLHKFNPTQTKPQSTVINI